MNTHSPDKEAGIIGPNLALPRLSLHQKSTNTLCIAYDWVVLFVASFSGWVAGDFQIPPMCVGLLVSVGVRCERCEAMTPFCLVRLPYYTKAALPMWHVAEFSESQRMQTGTTGVSNIN